MRPLMREHIVGLDFETYSAAPLPTVGLANYVADPTFTVTLAAIADEHGTTCALFPTGDILRPRLEGATVVAHNAGFERAVLRHLGIDIPVLDSAVVAAMAGADRHLAGAARQLMDIPKLDEDRSLLRLFAMPQPEQVEHGNLEFDMRLPRDNPDKWDQFIEYCQRDAELSRHIFLEWRDVFPSSLFAREMDYAQLTLAMNERGWPVDVESARLMLDMYKANLDQIQKDFARRCDRDLNLFSHDQVKKWCADRGVRSSSFDKQNVERMRQRLAKRQTSHGLTPGQEQVLFMLETKRELGGTSMKKLETLLDTVHDGRLYDQYFHVGAAQTWRTTGRGVQMQNLPRLSGNPRDMRELSMGKHWTNDEIGENLRQVFRASDSNGLLFVADFASIESRGLAWLAGEQWKLDSYRRGEDIYKAQARKIFNLQDVEKVTKDQRMTGKVGELSCGYGAGAGAVQDFAAKMGVELTEGEAKQLVWDWRDANLNIVKLWHNLGDALVRCVEMAQPSSVLLGDNWVVVFRRTATPISLKNLAPDSVSITMTLEHQGKVFMQRVFHGCYMRGNNVGYYKPSSLKGGDPWKKKWVDPKTKQQRYYELYGGKLAGILTQSMCREIFFGVLERLEVALEPYENCQIIGQFHDEIIVEWMPSGVLKAGTLHNIMDSVMDHSTRFPTLPMAVEVKSAPRYVK